MEGGNTGAQLQIHGLIETVCLENTLNFNRWCIQCTHRQEDRQGGGKLGGYWDLDCVLNFHHICEDLLGEYFLYPVDLERLTSSQHGSGWLTRPTLLTTLSGQLQLSAVMTLETSLTLTEVECHSSIPLHFATKLYHQDVKI